MGTVVTLDFKITGTPSATMNSARAFTEGGERPHVQHTGHANTEYDDVTDMR
jgi:hypothetical protein